MPNLEQEIRNFVTDYLSDYSRLDLKAVASYFHEPCIFTVPVGVLAFSSRSGVEGFFGPRFEDLKLQDFARTEGIEFNTKILSDDTALFSGKAVRYDRQGAELERRGVTFTLRKTDESWNITALIHHSADNTIQMS